MKDITSRLGGMCARRIELGFRVAMEGTVRSAWKGPRIIDLATELGENKTKIIEMVTKDEETHHWCNNLFVGMGGVGKII